MVVKVRKQLPPGMADELEALDVDQLKARIVASEMNVKDAELARKGDEGLAAAKERVKELDQPYKDAIKAQRAIALFSTLTLEDKGQ